MKGERRSVKRVEFGVRIPNSGPLASPANLVRAAAEAEALGYDSVWVHDHLAWSREMHRHHISSGASEALTEAQTSDFYESVVSLAYLAARTTRVKLGIACMILPARHPVYAAKQVAVLDVLSGGRTILGVGLGSRAAMASREFEVAGVLVQGRARRLEEYIQVLRAVWQQDRVSFQGEFISFTDAEIFPKPLQKPHPPIFVGGGTDAAARRAARYGDGWLPAWRTPAEMKAGVQVLAEEAEKVGRRADQLQVGLEILASIAPQRAKAVERARPTIEASLRTYERTMGSPEVAMQQSLIGSPEEVREQVEAFVDAGVSHFELKFIYRDMGEFTEQAELFAREVLAAFR